MAWPDDAYVGQRVVCVDDNYARCLRKGDIYTIEAIKPKYFQIVEARTALGLNSWHKSRFRPVQKRKNTAEERAARTLSTLLEQYRKEPVREGA